MQISGTKQPDYGIREHFKQIWIKMSPFIEYEDYLRNHKRIGPQPVCCQDKKIWIQIVYGPAAISYILMERRSCLKSHDFFHVHVFQYKNSPCS